MNNINFKTAIYVFTISLFICATGCRNTPDVNKENEITFDSIMVDKYYYLLGDTTNPHCNLELSFLYPVKYKDETVLRKIREYFILSFFGEDKTMLQPHEAVDKYIEEYISSYKELESDFEKEIKTTGHKPKAESWYSYYEASFNEIIYNKRDLLSYSVSIEYYTGGTHGGYGYNNFVLDLKTGNRLKEQDIFIPEYQDELSKIIVKALMAQNEVSKTHDLESIGFFNVEEIYPNNNFSIDEEGITYTFNEYEIAPYTIGRTDVFLNFDSVKHLINPESIVFRLIPLQKKNNPSRRDR